MSPRLLQLLLCSALVRFSMSVCPIEITSTRGSRRDYIYSRIPPRLHLLTDPAEITSTRGSCRDYIYSRIPPRLHLLADPAEITSTRGSRRDYIYLRIPPRLHLLADPAKITSTRGSRTSRQSCVQVHIQPLPYPHAYEYAFMRTSMHLLSKLPNRLLSTSSSRFLG